MSSPIHGVNRELLAAMISFRKKEKTLAKHWHAILAIAKGLAEIADKSIYEIAAIFQFRKSVFAKYWGKQEVVKKKGAFRKSVHYPSMSEKEVMTIRNIEKCVAYARENLTITEQKRVWAVLKYGAYILWSKKNGQ